ncbi:MAG: DUF349 domain-containing protein [Flavobacteriales bacterium]|nr:DUF349 domain-containing protein [Flavobacteriales bacterium]
MLEEKNDNLPVNENEADGNANNETQETISTENQEVEAVADAVEATENLVPDTEVEAPLTEETEIQAQPEIEDLVGEEIETATETEALDEIIAETTTESAEEVAEVTPVEETVEVEETPTVEAEAENVIELTDEEVADDNVVYESESDVVMNAISNVNAEESEDETLKDRHDIPMEDYEAMSMEKLVDELEKLVAVEKVMSVKDHVEEVRKSFLEKYHHFIDEKKDEFHAENPDSTEDFHYHFPLKTNFDNLYNQYRTKKAAHFKSLQSNLEANLKNRLDLVEELKNLVNNPTGNIANSLKQLNDIRERWKNAGPIPKDKYNHVWNNYHFHIENFYDFLHLDREARDLDFKHNLEQKQKIIARVEELVNESDINKAFRELQDLHRIWKEEIGPVSRDQREAIWVQFSDLTKQMHDKRETYYESFREKENENLAAKKEIIAQIEVLATEKVDSHAAWQAQMEKVEALRNTFFAAGKVPSEVNEQTWAEFKKAVKDFNVLKNSFYKEIKKDQNDNLSKKQALVAKANELKDSEDFAATTPIMKQIQEEWRTVGHVPRKFSDKLWGEFKAACNHYFERLKDSKKEENAEEVAAFEKKKEYLETLKSFELVGDHKTDLDAIKAHIEAWKSLGRVPFNRRHIEGKFNKILDALFEKLSSSKKEGEMMRFANRLDQLSSSDDSRKLDNEKIFMMRKIDEIQGEIFQLENNIQFFANAKADNPMVKEVRKNIERQKEELQVWKDKLKQLRNLNKE